jgi:hypothetical protein
VGLLLGPLLLGVGAVEEPPLERPPVLPHLRPHERQPGDGDHLALVDLDHVTLGRDPGRLGDGALKRRSGRLVLLGHHAVYTQLQVAVPSHLASQSSLATRFSAGVAPVSRPDGQMFELACWP